MLVQSVTGSWPLQDRVPRVFDDTHNDLAVGANEASSVGSVAKIRQTEPSEHSKTTWSRESWRSKAIAQHIEYPDHAHLEAVCEELHRLPPLVTRAEVEQALGYVDDAANGKVFIIQGGDCAENFGNVQLRSISNHMALLHKQQSILKCGLGIPVIQIGRIAGQYAKPRSKPFETLPTGEVVHAFCGHSVNSDRLSSVERRPDPQRLLLGYLYAAVTLNTIHRVRQTTLQSPRDIDISNSHLTAPYFTSHEALHLPYETALTHDSYNLSAAVLWVGERTRQLECAHIEYVRGLRNPVGIKIGPGAEPETVVALLDRISTRGCSRTFLITRFGQGKADLYLPAIVTAVHASGHRPAWICDPCHGNTFSTVETNTKTRHVDALLKETKEVHLILQQHNVRLGGLHLEQSGCNVTECVDHHKVTSSDMLKRNYQSLCDPRLNAEQAVWLIEQFVQFVKENAHSAYPNSKY